MKQQSKKDKILSKRNPNVKIEEVKKQPKGQLQHLPTIQTMLQVPHQDRAKKAFEFFKKIKNFVHSFILKKQGSRVTQLIYKWGNQQIKTSIHQSILQHWKDLIKSKYALFMIGKVLKDFQISQIVEDLVTLQNNREGAQILENYMKNYPESQNTHALKKKVFSLQKSAQDGDIKSQQILHNLALKSIQKQYHHHVLSKMILGFALSSMFPEQKDKCLEFLIQHVSDIVSDEEGIKLFIEIMNNASSKQKKNIVKKFKGHLEQIINNNNVSYVSVIKLITEMDDTVFLGKTLLTELIQLFSNLQKNKRLYNIIMSLLSPRNNSFNCLGKYERIVKNTECKKSQEQRKKEVRNYLYEQLIQILTSEENIDKTCQDLEFSRLALGLAKSMESDHYDGLKKFTTTLCNHFLKDLGKKIKDIENSLVANNFGSKLIKNILLMQEPYIDKFCDKFCESFNKNLEKVLKSKASFVLSVLVEKGGRDWILQEIKRLKLNLNEVIAGDFYRQRL